MFAVLKREFRSYFQNVIGWLFVGCPYGFVRVVFLCRYPQSENLLFSDASADW